MLRVELWRMVRQRLGWCIRLALLAMLAPGLAFATSASTLADTRVALVVGNSAYQYVPALPNPLNDANDVAATLERLGFSVRRLADASFDDLRRALLEFGPRARSAEIALVFFAGHGMEIGGENWLIPVDAAL